MPNFWFSQLVTCITIILLVITENYIFTIFTNKTNNNIAEFIFYMIATFIGEYFGYIVLNYELLHSELISLSMICFGIIFGVYILGIFIPPQVSLCKNPKVSNYHLFNRN